MDGGIKNVVCMGFLNISGHYYTKFHGFRTFPHFAEILRSFWTIFGVSETWRTLHSGRFVYVRHVSKALAQQ